MRWLQPCCNDLRTPAQRAPLRCVPNQDAVVKGVRSRSACQQDFYVCTHSARSCCRRAPERPSAWWFTEKFPAGGQSAVGKTGHVLAVLTHGLWPEEVAAMRGAGVPLQMINGCHDVVAGLTHVRCLARRLACPLILTEGAHADICLETPGAINAAMERIIGVVSLVCV